MYAICILSISRLNPYCPCPSALSRFHSVCGTFKSSVFVKITSVPDSPIYSGCMYNIVLLFILVTLNDNPRITIKSPAVS